MKVSSFVPPVAAALAAALVLVSPVAAQVRGSAAVDASGQPVGQAGQASLDSRLEGGYRDPDYRIPEPDYDYRPQEDARSGSDGAVRGYDGTSYDPQAYTDRYRDMTDDYRRESDTYRYERTYGYEGRGYYDRPYDRDYRPRYPSRPNVDYRYSGRGGSSFGISVDLGDVTIGYRDGFRDGYYLYYNGRNRYRDRGWRQGYSYTPRGCHPVSFTQWRYGRPVRVGATMCYDRYGYGYVLPGSERTIY